MSFVSRRDFLKLTSSAAMLLPLLDVPLPWAESHDAHRVVRVRQSKRDYTCPKTSQPLKSLKFRSAADAIRACAGRRAHMEVFWE